MAYGQMVVDRPSRSQQVSDEVSRTPSTPSFLLTYNLYASFRQLQSNNTCSLGDFCSNARAMRVASISLSMLESMEFSAVVFEGCLRRQDRAVDNERPLATALDTNLLPPSSKPISVQKLGNSLFSTAHLESITRTAGCISARPCTVTSYMYFADCSSCPGVRVLVTSIHVLPQSRIEPCLWAMVGRTSCG